MNKQQFIKTLEQIVEQNGDCLHHSLCEKCPFKSKCLPTFIKSTGTMTKTERFSLALNTLTNEVLLETYDDDHDDFFSNRNRC